MVVQLTAEGRRYLGSVRVSAALVAAFAGLLACFQVVGAVDFVFQRDARAFGGTSAIVGLLVLDALSATALGSAAWALGRFAAGCRLRWLLGAALLVVGVVLTFVSWVWWLGHFSGG